MPALGMEELKYGCVNRNSNTNQMKNLTLIFIPVALLLASCSVEEEPELVLSSMQINLISVQDFPGTDNGNNWDFWTSLPEALHQVTIVMSDRGIPATYRHMHGFGSHTFSMINADNERVWVKFHLKTNQGIKNLTSAEAEAIIGKDRESHQADLYQSIEDGDFPSWQMKIQVMTEEQAASVSFNPFDLTKVWSQKDFPLIDVGVLELNKNPENFFAEVEQSAFNPASVVPGISFSPDKMLQGRLFSYGDAQRYRLTVNFHQIPVNSPKAALHVNSYHRDGLMRIDGNRGGMTSYEPNTKGAFQEQPDFREPPLSIEGAAGHWNHRVDDDYFSQPGNLFRKMSPKEKQSLFDNTARALRGVSAPIIALHIKHCTLADPEYGAGVTEAVERIHSA